jgi:hypothetical protein
VRVALKQEEKEMDTTQMIEKIDLFIRERRGGDVVDQWAQMLWDALQDGATAPDWDAFESGTGYYQCRKVHMDRGEREAY